MRSILPPLLTQIQIFHAGLSLLSARHRVRLLVVRRDLIVTLRCQCRAVGAGDLERFTFWLKVDGPSNLIMSARACLDRLWHEHYLTETAEVRPMALLRKMVAVLLSIGLVLAPVAVANAAVAMQTAHADQVSGAAPHSMDDDCDCCDLAGKCAAAFCSTSCLQLGPTSDAVYEVILIGHAPLRGIVPLRLHGVAWRPPTPPPRV